MCGCDRSRAAGGSGGGGAAGGGGGEGGTISAELVVEQVARAQRKLAQLRKEEMLLEGIAEAKATLDLDKLQRLLLEARRRRTRASQTKDRRTSQTKDDTASPNELRGFFRSSAVVDQERKNDASAFEGAFPSPRMCCGRERATTRRLGRIESPGAHH